MIENISTKVIYKKLKNDNLLDPSLKYEDFSKIIKLFNKAIVREIIEGYKFSTDVGLFEIITYRRNKPLETAVDWDASKKNRQRLIDEGRLPYDSKYAPEGEYWFIYYTDCQNIRWKWAKERKVKRWYTFIVCGQNKVKLGQVINKKKQEVTENYNVSVPKNYIKPTCNFEDFQNLQTQ